jgi:hypothetical protein
MGSQPEISPRVTAYPVGRTRFRAAVDSAASRWTPDRCAPIATAGTGVRFAQPADAIPYAVAAVTADPNEGSTAARPYAVAASANGQDRMFSWCNVKRQASACYGSSYSGRSPGPASSSKGSLWARKGRTTSRFHISPQAAAVAAG